MQNVPPLKLTQIIAKKKTSKRKGRRSIEPAEKALTRTKYKKKCFSQAQNKNKNTSTNKTKTKRWAVLLRQERKKPSINTEKIVPDS